MENMRIKVYMVDVRFPRWVRPALAAAGVALVLVGLSAFVYAAAVKGQPDYKDGDVLTAASLNDHLAALQDQIKPFPPKTVVFATLSAADLADASQFQATGLGVGNYLGWAVCNGNNGTADLTGRFPRMVATGAGAKGGEDTNSHTHDRGNHQHQENIGWDGNFYFGKDDSDKLPFDGSVVESGLTISAASVTTIGANWSGRFAKTRTDGSGNTEVPSDTENRPAFYELVPLCKI
jgi:hypothetical protein